MKRRDETIGRLGRSPARPSKGTMPPPEGQDRSALASWLHGALVDNLGLKFLSLVLAITVFLLVNTDRDQEKTAQVRVAYMMPDDKVLISEQLDEVRVTLKGRAQYIRKFDGHMDPINIDLRRAQSGEITITPDMLSPPSGLVVTSVNPRTIRVQFDRRIEKIVEITAQLTGQPMHGFEVSEVKVTPATIKIRGAKSTLDALTTVRTTEVSVEGRAESYTPDTKETKAVMPDGVEPVGSTDVVIQVGIDEELVTRRLPGLAVKLAGESTDPARWQLEPAQVEVTLTGTLLAIEKAKLAVAPIKPTPNDIRNGKVAVTIEGLPPGIGVKIFPERVKISPIPRTPTPPPPPTP